MIQLDSTTGYTTVFVIAVVFGIVGGLAAEFLLNRDGQTGTFELPGRREGVYDFGGFANLFVGGVAGTAILLVFPPTSITIQGAAGTPATVVGGYDPIRLAVTALVAGSAGASVLTALQARVVAALSQAEAKLTEQTSKLEIDRLKVESTKAATDALRDLAAATPPAGAAPSSRRGGRLGSPQMDMQPGGPSSGALEDAIASVTQRIETQADQAKETVSAVRVTPR
jgi:hypothetical protein